MLSMKTPAPEMFRSGRQFAAWIGLTPKDHSTAGKVRLGVITRAGDEGLRSALVVGATAVIRHLRNGNGRSMLSAWVEQLLKRKPPKLAAVALANKTARIARKVMLTGGSLRRESRSRSLGRRGLETSPPWVSFHCVSFRPTLYGPHHANHPGTA
jgi:transposase